MQKIAVFYHVAKMGGWRQIDLQIMDRLKRFGLLDAASIFIRNECLDVGLFEFPTLELMREFAIKNPDYICLYIHTKGATQPDCKAISDWRECMLYFLVEKWQDCVNHLRGNNETCSINYLKTPMPHYQGNFFWAKAKYIRTLPDIRQIPMPKSKNIIFEERHKCEMWILSKAKRIVSLYHHGINPYTTENPRKNYVK